MARHIDGDGDGIADYAQHTAPGAHPFDVDTAVEASAPAVASRPELVEQLDLTDGPVDDEPSVAGVEAGVDEVADALRATGYVYTDPVADETHPRITASGYGDDVEDAFPVGWGSTLTERDAAVVEAKGGMA